MEEWIKTILLGIYWKMHLYSHREVNYKDSHLIIP